MPYDKASFSLPSLSVKKVIHENDPVAVDDAFAPGSLRARSYDGVDQQSYIAAAQVVNTNGLFVITIRNKHGVDNAGVLLAQLADLAVDLPEFSIEWLAGNLLKATVFDTGDITKSVASTSTDMSAIVTIGDENQFTFVFDAFTGKTVGIFANGLEVTYTTENVLANSGPDAFDGGTVIDELSIANVASTSTTDNYYQNTIAKIEIFDGVTFTAAVVKEQYYDQQGPLKQTLLRSKASSTGVDRPRRAVETELVTVTADDQTGFLDKSFYGISSLGWDKDYPAITATIKARYLNEDGSPGYEHLVGRADGVPITIDLAQGADGSSFPLDLAATADEINILFSGAVTGVFALSKGG